MKDILETTSLPSEFKGEKATFIWEVSQRNAE
jgi:hypothetical protein